MTSRLALLIVSAAAVMGLGGLTVPGAVADDGCTPGGALPAHAASKDVSAVYGQPATLWINDTTIGISTSAGYGEAAIQSPSPLQRSALLVDAQQDGNHQIIVDTGREVQLFAVSGCTISPSVDRNGTCVTPLRTCEAGEPVLLDVGHRFGKADGVGCGDVGDGPRLVSFLNLADDAGMMRRTEIDFDGPDLTVGRSDTVPQTTDVSCGGLTMARDAVEAPY